jgi:hypothetical protein
LVKGFVIRAITNSNGGLLVAGDGNLPDPQLNQMLVNVNTARIYSMYTILETVGYGFLQPKRPTIPVTLVFSASMNTTESPRWPVRGWHYHTEHPLELTNFFNGWGLNGTDDEASWSMMLSHDWPSFLEWLVANRQNSIEIVLLRAESWDQFAYGPVRQARFQKMTAMSAEWGIALGADVGIAEQQQHAWFMTDGSGTLQQQIQQIQLRVDWLAAAGFHFISTESGFTEFTHPNCTVMLAWMDAVTTYAAQRYQKRTFIKVHISTGQSCPDYVDPVTKKKPMNFNYLPAYAVKNLAVLPHTVQYYSFVDPAPTYGQTNFTSMYDFMFVEAPQRDTIYHGETAYWVNYDIDVPLFLPVYARGRLFDLRMAAQQEDKTGVHIKGQMNFESGWEWSYWFANTMTARAAWNPFHTEPTLDATMERSFTYLTRLFGPVSNQLNSWMVRFVKMQHELFVLGAVNGTRPESVVKLNAQAYLQGWDTWGQLMALVGTTQTQPISWSIDSMRFNLDQSFYSQKLRPLLAETAAQLAASLQELEAMSSQVPSNVLDLYSDLADTLQLTAVRAQFTLDIYDSLWRGLSVIQQQQSLARSFEGLKMAVKIIAKREESYAFPVERSSFWKPNPTAYNYGYLWKVHSAYFYFRDYRRAALQNPIALSPCFMNIIDPIQVLMGDGVADQLVNAARKWLHDKGFALLGDCFAAPAQEPHYSIDSL